MIFGDLVQARQILGNTVLEPETAPEIAVGAIDQKHSSLIVDQQVAPLQIIMGEAVVVHGPGVLGQLTTDGIDPGAVRQLRVVALGQCRQVLGTRQLPGNHRAASVGRTAPLQPPGHHFGSGDTPLGKALEVLPFHLHPRLAQVTPQAFAGAHIPFDVIVDAIALDTDDLRERVTGQTLALQRKHSLEAAEVIGQLAVGRFQLPTRHQSASPYRCLRS
ncbi:hypothetical protein D3C73_1028470 [compost metagenome]